MHTYTPYGNSHVTVENPADPSATDTDRFTFSGKERDDESDLMYFEARYLATDTARFTGQDPLFWDIGREDRLFDPQLANSYSYAKNNPAVYVDPDGKNPLLALGAAGTRLLIRYGVTMGVGISVGVGVKLVDDVFSEGKTPSSEYIGAATTGGSTALMVSSGIGGLYSATTSGFVGNLVEQSVEGQGIDVTEAAQSGFVSGATSYAPIPNIKGINVGKGSYSSIQKQMNTKLGNGTIQNVGAGTVAKISAVEAVETAPSEIAGALVKPVSNITKKIGSIFKKK